MTAKVFMAPIEPPVMDYTKYDYEADKRRTNEYLRELAQMGIDRQKRAGRKVDFCIGRTLAFPVADGAAMYMVWDMKPLQLIHIALHDAWHADPMTLRGLRISDVRARTKPGLFGEDSHMEGVTK